jgi:hypothetical protein
VAPLVWRKNYYHTYQRRNKLKTRAITGLTTALKVVASALVAIAVPTMAAKPIIHDGEYYFVEAQYKDAWAKEDKDIETKLANLREKNRGKRPNILYVLIDDVSFGQMGKPAMNHVMGVDTPRINEFSKQGMSLNRMYTEPSCTPTRAAFLTGRHPIRTGIKEVKVALVGEGMSADEVSIAEILSKAGYNTAHVGKWHQGDIEQAYPHNQGFDFAAFPLHQQVQLALMSKEAAQANNLLGGASYDPVRRVRPGQEVQTTGAGDRRRGTQGRHGTGDRPRTR